MSIRLYLVIICLGFFIGIESKPVKSDKISERIEYLLNLTQMEKKFTGVLDAYITNDPNLSMFKFEVTKFIDQFLSFQSLRPHIVEIYRDLYTLSDINAMIKFYSSAVGKKIVEKESKAELRLAQLIQNQLQKQMPQIITWFQQAFNKDYSTKQIN